MSKLYVIGVYGYKNCSLLHTDGRTLEECRRAIAWQNSPTPCGIPFHICKPTDERGVFASIETGNHFAINRGALTEEAYNRALDEIWPTA